MVRPTAPTSMRRCRAAFAADDAVSPPRSGSAARPAVCSTSYVARCMAVAMRRRARKRITASTAAVSAATTTTTAITWLPTLPILTASHRKRQGRRRPAGPAHNSAPPDFVERYCLVAPEWPDYRSRDTHGKAERSASAGRRHRELPHRRLARAQGRSGRGPRRLGRDRGRPRRHAGVRGVGDRADPGAAGPGPGLVPATGRTPSRTEPSHLDHPDRPARPAGPGRLPGRAPRLAPAPGGPAGGRSRDRSGTPVADRRRPGGATAADRPVVLGTTPPPGGRADR